MKTKLKRCPFCGSTDISGFCRLIGVISKEGKELNSSMICNNCYASGPAISDIKDDGIPLDYESFNNKIIKLWNKRVYESKED